MTSTDAMIQDLSASLVPVQRRSVRREAAALLALGAVELALVLMSGFMRPDLTQVILSPYMAWKIGCLTVLAVASCTVAIRSFAPPSSLPRGLVLLPVLASLIMIGGAFVTDAADSSRSFLDRLMPVHGILCAVSIVVLALPVMALLGVLMRRAAPARPTRSAWVSGIAASACSALIFTACCPMNDPLYIIVWYTLGIAAVAAAARLVLPRRFRL